MEPEDPLPPDPRDILKRDHDEALKRPRNEALEKHGANIEAEILRRFGDKAAPTVAPKKPRDKKGPDMDMG